MVGTEKGGETQEKTMGMIPHIIIINKLIFDRYGRIL